MEMVPPLEVGSPLELVPPLEVGPPLEVAAGSGYGQEKRGQGEAEMGPDQGLEETGSWKESIWRRDRVDWR